MAKVRTNKNMENTVALIKILTQLIENDRLCLQQDDDLLKINYVGVLFDLHGFPRKIVFRKEP